MKTKDKILLIAIRYSDVGHDDPFAFDINEGVLFSVPRVFSNRRTARIYEKFFRSDDRYEVFFLKTDQSPNELLRSLSADYNMEFSPWIEGSLAVLRKN